MTASVTIVQALLPIITVCLMVCAGVAVWMVARYTERETQREERHQLRAERDAYRLLLEQNGVELPEGHRRAGD